MKKLVIALLFFFFLIPISNAQLITIGVTPSKVSLDFFKAKSYKVEFGFSNDAGEVDAVYTLEPDDCLKDIIKDYPKEVLVPKGTKRTINPVKVWITFEPDFKGNKVCFLNVYAKPKGASEEGGMLRIKPSVGIKVEVKQPKTEAYYSMPSSPPQDVVRLPTTVGERPQTQVEDRVERVEESESKPTLEEEVEKKIEEGLRVGEDKGFSFPWLWVVGLGGLGLVCGVLVWRFRDYLPYLLPVFIFFSFLNKAYAVNVTVTVVPPPPPPVARFSTIFPIGALLLGILLPVVAIKFGEKYLLKGLSEGFPLSPIIIFLSFYLLILAIGWVASLL